MICSVAPGPGCSEPNYANPSLFQALGQWGQSKKRVCPPLFFLTDPARPAPAFSIVPTD